MFISHWVTLYNGHIYCEVPGSPCLSKTGPVYGPFSFQFFGVERTKGSLAGLSVRACGGGFLPAIRVWCAGYEVKMKADMFMIGGSV